MFTLHIYLNISIGIYEGITDDGGVCANPPTGGRPEISSLQKNGVGFL